MEWIPGPNYHRVITKIVTALKNELKSSGREGYVFGLSGGLDSSVVASLLSRAAAERTFALVMPRSSVTPQQDVSDATDLAKRLNIQFRIIDLTGIHSDILRELPTNKLASGNLLARIRMCLLYYYANQNNCLVAGTSNRSELLIGYFTKYGDGGADILPIASLYKTQVRALGYHLDLPDAILNKKSAPRLWEKHTAEEEIGMSYEDIDRILYNLFDRKASAKSTAKKLNMPLEKVEQIRQMHIKNAHKRSLPKICKL
ncbi:MAG: NAD+ synthase [Candidatus Nitrosomirales archaeon]|jgi:NAD+ synthase